MKVKHTLLNITVIVAVLFGISAQAGGVGSPNPFKKKGPPAKPVKAPIPPKPKPLIPTKYGGRAVAVDLGNIGAQAAWRVGDTGPLPRTGGCLSVTVGPTTLDLLSLGGATVTASGVGCVSYSTAEVTNFFATFIHMGVTNVIAFTSASAQARAECTSNGVVLLSASSQVVGLTIDGTNVVVTGEPNQVIAIAAGNVVLNAQLTSTNAKHGQISVAAVFLMLADCFTGPIAFAEADIKCGSRVPPGMRTCDKVTGGGFIVGTPSGAHGSFGVGGGTRRGQFWGHLNYIDHGTGMHVKATAVTGFAVIDAVTRQIDYDVTIDGVAGTARVLVADNGEPGRNDIFDITLSTGYHAGGSLAGDRPGGGNIQLHKCPPGWAK